MSGKKKKKAGPAPTPAQPDLQAEGAAKASETFNLANSGRQSTVLASSLLKPVAGTDNPVAAPTQSATTTTQTAASPQKRRRMLYGFGGTVIGR